MKLFEIDAQIEALLNASVDRETGEINEDALAELEALETQRDAKALAVAAYIVGQRCEADAIKAQAKRLADRAAIHARHADRLEAYIEAHVPEGVKLSDDRVTIGWRKSTAVEVYDDPAKLPERFSRVSYAADKVALKEALQAGEEIPGVALVTRRGIVVR